jgi:hypothetical protein
MSSNEPVPSPVELPKNRLYWGIGVWVTGQLSPLCIPLITASALSPSLKATISTLVFFCAPSLFTFIAITILGKDGFNFLKARLFAFFKRRVHTGSVSKCRYYIGLVLFVLPLLLAWITPYLSALTPFFDEHEIVIAFIGDSVLLISLLVLGGDFWEKLRNLFIYQPQPAPDTLES